MIGIAYFGNVWTSQSGNVTLQHVSLRGSETSWVSQEESTPRASMKYHVSVLSAQDRVPASAECGPIEDPFPVLSVQFENRSNKDRSREQPTRRV